ncbi:unnamed protein product [Sphagnum troendelagicum]|uniref:Radial spoke head protein 9 homolog n=1 Tax=Sphagnum troendelagicum TaxID=128251 RepID=A0ABP0THR8_9BRYO
MDSNLTLTLEALASCGCVIPSEHRAGLDISLKIKKMDAGLQSLAFWGRIFTTTGKDYLLAEGCVSAKRIGRKLNFDLKYYFSQNGVQWLDLQAPLTEERYELCKQCKGPFTGDPSNKFFVIPEPPQPSEFDEMIEPALIGDKSGSSPTDEKGTTSEEEQPEPVTEDESTAPATEDEDASDEPPGVGEEAKVIEDEEVVEGEEGEEGEGEEIPKGTEVPELERLAALMKMVDEDCGVVPYNALVMTPANVLVKNTTFSGPKFIDELDSYCHLFKGYHEAPISKDLPGSWSIHAIPLQRDVIVRSLLWPGYFMYYSDTGKDYGSGYFGMGEKNKDIAFCVP